MKDKITQQELVLRILNSIGGWVKSFNLRGVATE